MCPRKIFPYSPFNFPPGYFELIGVLFIYIKNYDTRLPLAPMVDKCIGEKDVCEMWQAHYKNFLNSVESSKSKESVERELHAIKDSAMVLTPIDIFNALKGTKPGIASGVDGPAAEHFINASPIIHVCLSLLFNCFVKHGYLPEDSMKTAIVYIIKNKTGDTSDKCNYRPISLHTTYMCIFNVKSAIKCYTKQNSSDHSCFSDAAQASDIFSYKVSYIHKL